MVKIFGRLSLILLRFEFIDWNHLICRQVKSKADLFINPLMSSIIL